MARVCVYVCVGVYAGWHFDRANSRNVCGRGFSNSGGAAISCCIVACMGFHGIVPNFVSPQPNCQQRRDPIEKTFRKKLQMPCLRDHCVIRFVGWLSHKILMDPFLVCEFSLRVFGYTWFVYMICCRSLCFFLGIW